MRSSCSSKRVLLASRASGVPRWRDALLLLPQCRTYYFLFRNINDSRSRFCKYLSLFGLKRKIKDVMRFFRFGGSLCVYIMRYRQQYYLRRCNYYYCSMYGIYIASVADVQHDIIRSVNNYRVLSEPIVNKRLGKISFEENAINPMITTVSVVI